MYVELLCLYRDGTQTLFKKQNKVTFFTAIVASITINAVDVLVNTNNLYFNQFMQ